MSLRYKIVHILNGCMDEVREVMAERFIGSELTVERQVSVALLCHSTVENFLEHSVGGFGIWVAYNRVLILGLLCDNLSDAHNLCALLLWRGIPTVHVSLVEVFEDYVKGGSVILRSTGVYHFGSQWVKACFIGIKLNVFVERGTAQSVGIEVCVVKQIGDIDTPVLRHFKLWN